MNEEGHNYRFGPPKGKGWPTFDKWTGKRIKAECIGSGTMCTRQLRLDMCGSCGKSGPTMVDERRGR